MSDVPYNPKLVLKLSNYPNTPFIKVMSTDRGIYSLIQKNAATKAKVPSVSEVIQQFDTTLSSDAYKIYDLFVNGKSGVEETLTRIVGVEATPTEMKEKIYNAIMPNQLKDQSGTGWATALLTDPLLFACSSYVEIEVTNSITNYHVAYIPPDVKSGRSYSNHPELSGVLDPSDSYFLKELNLLQSTSTLEGFLANVSQFLVSSTITGISNTTYLGDFTAIYTAELIRYAMNNYAAENCWASDLAKVTYLASYINPSYMLVLNGNFVQGNIINYADEGSIGDRKSDYDKLSELITNYLKDYNSSLVQQLEYSIGKSDTVDILGDVLYYLVTTSTDPDSSQQSTLINLLNEYVKTLINNYSAITNYIESNF